MTTTTSVTPQLKPKPPPPEAPPAVNKPQKWNTMRPAVPSTPKPPQLKRTESIEENSTRTTVSSRPRPAAPPPPPPPPSARPAVSAPNTDDLPPPPPPPRHASVESSQPQSVNYGTSKNNNNTWNRPTAQPISVPTYNPPSVAAPLGNSPILAGSHMRAVDVHATPSTPRAATKTSGKSLDERFRFLSVDQLPLPDTYAVGKHAAA